MNNVILFDDDQWKAMLPICLTRPIADIRLGILKISEKWEKYLDAEVSYITKDYLSEKFPIKISSDNLVINSRWLPDDKLVSLIKNLKTNDAILIQDTLVAARLDNEQFQRLIDNIEIHELKGIDLKEVHSFRSIERPYDIFKFNGEEIEKDFRLLKLSNSHSVDESVSIYGDHPVYIHPEAKLKHCILNAESGPIFIDKKCQIQEGAILRGPLAVCEGTVVKMGAKVYENSSFGPYCKIAGEISNVVFQGFANKAHDGYLGNSVIGEWCNLGAGTISSNLKNNYAEVKIWNYISKRFEKTGSQFCGLIMGDHSKTGINTMFNTGTVVGVCANIFGSGYPRVYIPSFSWGGAHGYSTFKIDKALELAEIVMNRRKKSLSDQDRIILEHVFHASADFRNWES